MVATAKPGLQTVVDDIMAYDRDRSRGDWPSTILEAYKGGRGPYTVRNAYTLLSEESLELYHGWLVWQEMTNAQERRVVEAIQEIISLVARAAGVGQAYPDQFECLMKNGNVLKPDLCAFQ